MWTGTTKWQYNYSGRDDLREKHGHCLMLTNNPKSYRLWLYPDMIVQYVRALQMSSRQIAA